MVKGGWGNPHKRRDRLFIISEILQIAKDGSLKTPIMYKANLGFAQLNEYLSLLLGIKLLEAIKTDGKTSYKTTGKGIKYLQSYMELRSILKERS